MMKGNGPKFYLASWAWPTGQGPRLRPDFTSKLVHVLAFGTPKFYIAPYDKIKHKLDNLSSTCDVKSGLRHFILKFGMFFPKTLRDNFSLIIDRFTSILPQVTGNGLNFIQ